MRSAWNAPRNAASAPGAPCSGCACTSVWSCSTRASASASWAAGAERVEAAVLGRVRGAPGLVEAAQQHPVLLDVAPRVPGCVPRPRQSRPGLLEVPGQRHGVAVGVELGEGEVEQAPRFVPLVA